MRTINPEPEGGHSAGRSVTSDGKRADSGARLTKSDDCSYKLALIAKPIHITLEKFENGVVTLQMHLAFSVHTTLKKFKKATKSSTILDLRFEEAAREKNLWYPG